jgi:hypothetical protein
VKRVALFVGVIAVAALGFLALHGGSKSEAKPSTERTVDVAPATAGPAASAPGPAPQLAGAAPAMKTGDVEHANVVNLPDSLEPGYLAIEHAAKGCYRGHVPPAPTRPNGPDETIDSIQLSYRQVSSHGAGHIEDLKVVHGTLSDQALQSCIVNAASGVTWSSTAPDGEIGSLEQNVNVGDLMRPDYGLPPESKRSPKPTAPPPPAMAAPLGQQAPEVADDHPDVVVPEPGLANQPK